MLCAALKYDHEAVKTVTSHVNGRQEIQQHRLQIVQL